MLGNKIYYPDDEDNSVKCGLIVGYTVNEEGFAVYTIKDGEKYIVLHQSLCSVDEKVAVEHLNKLVKTNRLIREIQNEANDKIDALLLELRGSPEYEYLTINAEKKAGK